MTNTTTHTKPLLPKLRFKEFEGEWEEIKFDKYCDFQQGVQVDVELQKTEPFEDYIRFLRIENYTQESNDFRFIPNIYKESKIITENDIVVVRYGATAGFIGRGKKGILANNLFKIIPDNSFFDNEYLYHYLKSYKAFHFFQTEMSGGAMPALSFGIVKALKVPISDIKEQQKIANFLTAVDTKLQQLTTKKETLALYKKGVMQQLFSQQLRFKDDDGSDFPDWEEKKLGDLTERNICYGVVQPGIEDDNGVKFIRGGDVFNGKISNDLRIISKEITDKYQRTYLKGGELIMSLVGYPGETAIVPDSLKGANLARQVGLIDLKKETNSMFVSYYISSDFGKKNLLGKTIGSAQQVINIIDLKKLKIPYPQLKEQQKIATYLSAIDKKIEAVQTQISNTQAFKKGLLQAMFV